MVSDAVREVDRLVTALGQTVTAWGYFGSYILAPNKEPGDLDILVIYNGDSFDFLKDRLFQIKPEFACCVSYLNYSSIDASKPSNGFYLDFIFMPSKKPNREFFRRHEGLISWHTKEYVPPPLTFDGTRREKENRSLSVIRSGR